MGVEAFSLAGGIDFVVVEFQMCEAELDPAGCVAALVTDGRKQSMFLLVKGKSWQLREDLHDAYSDSSRRSKLRLSALPIALGVPRVLYTVHVPKQRFVQG